MKYVRVERFDDWRRAARALRLAGVAPDRVVWEQGGQHSLFDAAVVDVVDGAADAAPADALRVPKAFLTLAQTVARFRGEARWGLLYRTLWRLTHEEPHLLTLYTDDDVYRLRAMERAVRRDAHKMQAFVRFRRVAGEDNAYIAWHAPLHYVVEPTAPFFARRFAAMRWSILTPDSSAHWNGRTLAFSPGVSRRAAPNGDEMETLWKTYYRHIFNPARIKLRAMKQEMPLRYWHTLPETELIPELLADAPARVRRMLR